MSASQSEPSLYYARLIEPRNGSVYTGNTISFLVDIKDREIDVKTIEYYVKRAYIVMGQEWIRKDILLGKVSKLPYQFIWDCTHFPDMPDLNFYAIVEDKNGNRFQTNIVTEVVIDRHVEFSSLTIKAPYVKTSVMCDGNLNESLWQKEAEPVYFPNGNNRIKFAAGWDKKNLYIGITVWDTKLFSCFDTTYSVEFLDSNPMFKIYYSDFISVYIDPLNRKTTLRDTTESEVRVSPMGYVNWRTSYRRRKSKGICLGKSKIYGTLNNAADEDSLWVIELALPWDVIGIVPKADYVMGFDVYNADREDAMLYRITSMWSGGGAVYVKNPSEWANILLVPQKSHWLFSYMTVFLVIPIFFIIIFLKKKNLVKLYFKKDRSIVLISPKEFLIKEINEFLEKNYRNDKLNIEELSKKLGFSKEYLMKAYKHSNHGSISKKLITIRIAKAKELIENSSKTLTEIAFDVGFNSSEVFIRNFKRLEGITPSQYKNRIKNTVDAHQQ